MAVLKKYDLTGKEIGQEEIAESLLKTSVSAQLIKDYIIALRANARQWTAHTKIRSEVNKVGQKAQEQKGLGRARHGALSAPQFRKGGVAHGPRAKFDQRVKVNRKAKRAVIRSLLTEKINESEAVVLKLKALKAPKTKTAADLFKKLKIDTKKVLILGSLADKNENFYKSLRNLPKKEFVYLSNINGYELANSQKLVVLESAMGELTAILGK